MRWPKKLICLWRGTRCTVLKLGLEGGIVEISYKGKSKLVPEEKIEIIKEDGKGYGFCSAWPSWALFSSSAA